jgi:3'-phosphoadenosine 5'-phosphosulfate sulfotransferase (PAPS reductase)/FAD synthetase
MDSSVWCAILAGGRNMSNFSSAYKELSEKQKWSLSQKIDHALYVIEAFKATIASKGLTPYVSFSGGKDSTVLLHLCRHFLGKDFPAVFCSTGNEFPNIIRFVKTFDNITVIRPKKKFHEIISTYGFPLVSKEQSKYIYDVRHSKNEKLIKIRLEGNNFSISDCHKFLIEAPFDVSDKCCSYLKKMPFAKYNKENNKRPLIGTRVEESKQRLIAYINRGACNSFTEGHEKSAPLSIWTTQDINEYIEQFDVNICDLYTKYGFKRTGCMVCGYGNVCSLNQRFMQLQTLYPKAYEKFLSIKNNGVSMKYALNYIGVELPDKHLSLFNYYYDSGK